MIVCLALCTISRYRKILTNFSHLLQLVQFVYFGKNTHSQLYFPLIRPPVFVTMVMDDVIGFLIAPHPFGIDFVNKFFTRKTPRNCITCSKDFLSHSCFCIDIVSLSTLSVIIITENDGDLSIFETDQMLDPIRSKSIRFVAK